MSSSHQDHPELPPPSVTEVADGIFAYIQPDGSWFINNTGFISGSETIISIDTCSTERRTRAYVETIERVAGALPRVLVNTHHHADHTNGNCLLPFATIVGHQSCRDEMLQAGITHYDGVFEPVEWGDLTLAAPFVTFEERLNLYVGDLEVQLVHLTEAAHTTNDVVAWIPERRVLYAGDLVFNGGTPFVVMGSVSGTLEALEAIRRLEPAVIVPGHGEPGGAELTDTCVSYLRLVQKVAAEAIASGASALDAARETDLGEFGQLLDSERLAGNLHRAMAEARGLAPGAPIDLVAAFTDMITLNGGRPLRCLA